MYLEKYPLFNNLNKFCFKTIAMKPNNHCNGIAISIVAPPNPFKIGYIHIKQ